MSFWRITENAPSAFRKPLACLTTRYPGLCALECKLLLVLLVSELPDNLLVVSTRRVPAKYLRCALPALENKRKRCNEVET